MDACARRDALRDELIIAGPICGGNGRRLKKSTKTKLETLCVQAQEAITRGQTTAAELSDRRQDEKDLSEEKGGIRAQLDQIAAQEKAFANFVEDLARPALANVALEVSKLERQVADANNEPREKAERQLRSIASWSRTNARRLLISIARW